MHRRFEKGIHGVIEVRAEFYSRVREIVGAPEIEVSLAENATVHDLFDKLRAKYPDLGDLEKSVLFGVGLEFVPRDHELNDGDTVAIMPPVQGG